jgi:hypothetical protein
MIFLTYLLTSFTYIATPNAFLRDEPVEISCIESEAFYSELVTILESHQDWLYVQMNDDQKGWIKMDQVYKRSEPFPLPNSIIAYIDRLSAHVYHIPNVKCGPILTLPFESMLEVLEQLDGPEEHWLKVKGPENQIGFIQRGNVTLEKNQLSRAEISAFSKRFLGLPYTWGGRSTFGYDCSGFVQMLYRQMGISIPRNSSDQIKWGGFRTIPLENLQPGDLIFFSSVQGGSGHVGMYTGNGEFIHSTLRENLPFLRISNLFTPPWDGSEPFTAYRTAKSYILK